MNGLLYTRAVCMILAAITIAAVLPAMRVSASAPTLDTRLYLPAISTNNQSANPALFKNNVKGLTVVVTAAPRQVLAGKSTQVVTIFVNRSKEKLAGTIAISAYTTNGMRVFSKELSNQSVKSYGTLTQAVALPIASNAAAGTYYVHVTFTGANTRLYYVNERAVTLKVVNRPGATATPQPTQTIAPTATPQPTQTIAPTATPQPTQTAVPTPKPAVTPVPTVVPTQPTERLFGVLQGTNQNLGRHYQAGMRLRTLEIGWNHYEPVEGQWNWGYVEEQRAKYQQMKDAGFHVVLDLGTQYPPDWAKQIQPWKDQYGNTFYDEVNAVWSPVVRAQMEQYMEHVFTHLGADFYGVRLGSGAFVETLYPNSAPGFEFSYWAFDADAMVSNPVQGWKPGDASPNGEARRFYEWYLGQLINTVNWQQNAVRTHFKGYLIQLMPGQGLRPTQYETLIASNLMPHGKNIYSAERGAVWDRIMDGMQNRTNVIINCSSVGDSSATSPYLNEDSVDPIYWSSAHWVAHNADRYGLPKMAENPGRSDFKTMEVTFDQVERYGYSTLFWAFEPDFTNRSYASLDQYSQMIKADR